jgi:fructokinase
VGELLWDLLPQGGQKKLGGAPFNFAYRTTTLGDRGLIVSRVGDDHLGQEALAKARELHMDVTYVQVDPELPTGTVEVTVKDGEPEYRIIPGVAYDALAATDELASLVRHADCVCFGTLVQRTEHMRRTMARLLCSEGVSPSCIAGILPAQDQGHSRTTGKMPVELMGETPMLRKSGPLKLLDLNLRKDCYSDASVRWSLEHADVLKLNEDEAAHLATLLNLPPAPEDFCRAIVEARRLRAAVVTMGPRGALAADAEGGLAYEPGYAVSVVDTVGSGDAFTAAFMHEYLRGRPLADCCRLGCALGAMVAMQSGPTGLITPAELDAFMAAPPPRVTAERK